MSEETRTVLLNGVPVTLEKIATVSDEHDPDAIFVRKINAQSRARSARYRQTAKGKATGKAYEKKRYEKRKSDPARKELVNACNKARRQSAKHKKSQWPFCPIDAEGVNLVELSWCENAEGENIGPHFLEWLKTADRAWFKRVNIARSRRRWPKLDWNSLNGCDDKRPWTGETLNPNSDRVWQEYCRETGNVLYMPQKIVCIAIGTGDNIQTLPNHVTPGMLGRDAPALGAEEVLDFLYDAFPLHKDEFFIMYGCGYDFTEILRGIDPNVAWEIQNQMLIRNKDFPRGKRDDPDVDHKAYWMLYDENGKPRKCFVINYLPRKWFKLGRITAFPDPLPEGWPYCRDENGNSRHIAYGHGSRLMEIHDTVSLFQCSFIKAMEGMGSSIEVSPDDRALIEWGKPRRGVFVDEPMEKIIAYNQAELNVLVSTMNAYRKAFNELGIFPTAWYGPGAIAKEYLIKEKILPRKYKGTIIEPGHFPPEEVLSANGASRAQKWAMRAFSGGCIDLIQLGVYSDEALPIHQYDITSAYPFWIAELQSQWDCTYKHVKQKIVSLQEIKAFVESSNLLSMFDIRWNFRESVNYKPLRFYPFFYRTNGANSRGFIDIEADLKNGIEHDPEVVANARNNSAGRILYPARGRGRYYQQEVLAAIAWCETFPDAVIRFELNAAMIFVPHPSVEDERPFAFVRDLFDERARIVTDTKAAKKAWEEGGCIGTEPYNIMEKAIKLVLNSLYGKMSQSLGNPGKLPIATNPFYSGAITAGTRAQLHFAALKDPDRVIQFATDAILSAGPMRGLETTPQKILGTWEHAGEADMSEAGIFLHPGLSSFYDLKRGEQTKLRGCKIEFGRDFLMRDVRRAWKTGEPKISIVQTNLITLGLALNADKNWPKCGTWKTAPREIDVGRAGTKRNRCDDRARADCLVPVTPRENLEPVNMLSAPYIPQWLVDDEFRENMLEHEGGEAFDMQFGDVHIEQGEFE